MAENKLLILEEAVLIGMAGNPNFVKEFGFLKSLNQLNTTKKGKCRPCGQRTSKRIQMINAAKQSILTMGAQKKVRLKTMLKADKVRLRVQAGGKIREHTF